MAKLWQKDYQVNSILEDFSVGIDYQLDTRLVPADCAGSIAHARMLNSCGYLTDEDLGKLEAALKSIAADAVAGNFTVEKSDEDCHTAIENRLVELAGEAGKRIHLGRSRNDQVLTVTRLYGRETLLELRGRLYSLISAVLAFAKTHQSLSMPGRTHMQIAMPSTIGLWAGALAEDLLDAAELLNTAVKLFDRSPLGAAAGYGVPLALNREYSARQMGFPAVQNNVISVQNSRGRLEGMICDSLSSVMAALAKYAQDLILFSLPEFGYFKLPDELCTGSSIMPQKKNPDGLELMRSRSASVAGWAAQIRSITANLPTGYNRDFQDSKEPFLRTLDTVLPAISIMEVSFTKVEVNTQRLLVAHTPELFATDEAIRLVLSGMTFRDAYREVAANLDKLDGYTPESGLASRTSTGYPGNPNFAAAEQRLGAMMGELESQDERHHKAISGLLGEGIALI